MVEQVREAVKMANIEWKEIDYLEACRYIALNSTAEECAVNPIRRVLPWRRYNHGSRPGFKGAGPRVRQGGTSSSGASLR